MKEKRKVKISGDLRLHWQWDLVLAFSLIILTIAMFRINTRAGIVALVFSGLYILVVLLLYLRMRPGILQELMRFAARYGQMQNQLMKEFELPLALLQPDGKTLWQNDAMLDLTGKKDSFHRSISTVFPEITEGTLPITEWDKDIPVTYGDRKFRAHISRIPIDELVDESVILEREGEMGEYLHFLCLHDETELARTGQELRDRSPVVSLVYIDNYEETVERLDDVHKSMMTVLAERRIIKYFTAMGSLVRRLEKDKFLVLCDRKALDALEEDRFSILEGVKGINVGADQPFTISIGVGLGGTGYQQDSDLSRAAIEMALGRGGDQAVVRDGEKITFYGGKSQAGERSTRVKARVKAQAMREIIDAAERVVVMGHQRTDLDSLGACVGIYRAARTMNKEAHIVVGEANEGIRLWLGRFKDMREYEPAMVIGREDAISLVDRNTVVIVVDTNRRGMVDCEEILGQTDTVILLDHHRQTTDTIQDASLSYIETSASSACEMVAEILQYFGEDVRLRPVEADCMYAGIIIDTNSFVAKTGARTFDAAAYLRRAGADPVRVRKALRESMDSYKARAEAVRHAESYMDNYAITICPSDGVQSPNVVGAQAANELLGIKGVKASFVITEYDSRIFISARSIDEVNVQIIMERLGGGGHSNIAGAQLTGMTSEEAVEKVKEVLKQMTEEGEI